MPCKYLQQRSGLHNLRSPRVAACCLEKRRLFLSFCGRLKELSVNEVMLYPSRVKKNTLSQLIVDVNLGTFKASLPYKLIYKLPWRRWHARWRWHGTWSGDTERKQERWLSQNKLFKNYVVWKSRWSTNETVRLTSFGLQGGFNTSSMGIRYIWKIWSQIWEALSFEPILSIHLMEVHNDLRIFQS